MCSKCPRLNCVYIYKVQMAGTKTKVYYGKKKKHTAYVSCACEIVWE